MLRLYDPEADKILKAARSSPSNRRLVIYGIARNTQEALRYSSYGINAVLDEPLDRQSVLKIVRATHLLVIHELRRYVRVPLAAQAEVDTGSRGNAQVTTVEVSSGGISVRSEHSSAQIGRSRADPYATRNGKAQRPRLYLLAPRD